MNVLQTKPMPSSRMKESSMPDDRKDEDSTQVRKIKSENELDQIDDSILDQVSGGARKNNEDDETKEVEDLPITPLFDPSSIIE
jgi:hypothetical protein